MKITITDITDHWKDEQMMDGDASHEGWGAVNTLYAEEICEVIRKSKFRRFIYDRTWLSGSSTVVYPLTIWRHDIEIQLNPCCPHRGRYAAFRALLMQLKKRWPHLTGRYWRSDGSCPSTYTIYFNNH